MGLPSSNRQTILINTMKISTVTLSFLLANSSSSTVAAFGNNSGGFGGARRQPSTHFSTCSTRWIPSIKPTSSSGALSSSPFQYDSDAIDAFARQAAHAADEALAAAASIPVSIPGTRSTAPRFGERKRVHGAERATTSIAAAAAAVSCSFPLTAMAATSAATINEAHDALSSSIGAMESTSLLLDYGEVISSLQFLYTAVLVAGVGYTQRMAGREDFKKEMARKISNGEITAEEVSCVTSLVGLSVPGIVCHNIHHAFLALAIVTYGGRG